MKHYPDLLTDLKILAGNFGVGLFVTFTDADAVLKFFLTAVVIGYTTHKWYYMYLDRKEKKESKNHNNNEKED
jgi:hypothetical protein